MLLVDITQSITPTLLSHSILIDNAFLDKSIITSAKVQPFHPLHCQAILSQGTTLLPVENYKILSIPLTMSTHSIMIDYFNLATEISPFILHIRLNSMQLQHPTYPTSIIHHKICPITEVTVVRIKQDLHVACLSQKLQSQMT